MPCRGRVVENVFFAWVIGRLKFLLSPGYGERERKREIRVNGRIIWNNGYVENGRRREEREVYTLYKYNVLPNE